MTGQGTGVVMVFVGPRTGMVVIGPGTGAVVVGPGTGMAVVALGTGIVVVGGMSTVTPQNSFQSYLTTQLLVLPGFGYGIERVVVFTSYHSTIARGNVVKEHINIVSYKMHLQV